MNNNAYRWITPLDENIECDMFINGDSVSITIDGSFIVKTEKQYQFILELNNLIKKYSLENEKCKQN